jgi:hypothetical protein
MVMWSVGICPNFRFQGKKVKVSKNHKSEFEVPPQTKVRIVATVDRKLCDDMELIHEKEVERAKKEDRTEPDWSNTIEMLLRKGVKSYKSSVTS